MDEVEDEINEWNLFERLQLVVFMMFITGFTVLLTTSPVVFVEPFEQLDLYDRLQTNDNVPQIITMRMNDIITNATRLSFFEPYSYDERVMNDIETSQNHKENKVEFDSKDDRRIEKLANLVIGTIQFERFIETVQTEDEDRKRKLGSTVQDRKTIFDRTFPSLLNNGVPPKSISFVKRIMDKVEEKARAEYQTRKYKRDNEEKLMATTIYEDFDMGIVVI